MTPASERWIHRFCLLFAVWTLCCHLVVFLKGNLAQLLTLSLALLLVTVLVMRRTKQGVPTSRGQDIERVRRAARAAPVAGEPDRDVERLALQIGLPLVALSLLLQRPLLLWWGGLGLMLMGWWRLGWWRVGTPEVVEVPAKSSRRAEMALWGLGLVAAVAALMLHRPDLDDAFYVNVAVATSQQPAAALLANDTLHGEPDLPIHLPVYRVHSYELFWGAVAYLTGLPSLALFHLLAAPLAAVLLVMANASLLRRLVPERWPWALLALVVILLAVGGVHRWYGNLALVRMWQGKAVYLFVFLPLVYAYALDFGRRPTGRRWLMLAAAQIAALGCTSSSVWAAPFGGMLALLAVVRLDWSGLWRLLAGALTSFYVLGLGWLLKMQIEEVQLIGSGVKEKLPYGAKFMQALEEVLGDGRLWLFGVCAMMLTWAFCRRGLAQRFALVVPLGGMLLLLNPYLYTWVRANITGPSYWRAFWFLPLPLLMAILLTTPLARRQGLAQGLRAVAALVAFVFLVPSMSVLAAENRVRFGWPGLKVPQPAFELAQTLKEVVPAGARVLAPPRVSAWIPTLEDHPYPVFVRMPYLARMEDELEPGGFELRMRLTRFVGGLRRTAQLVPAEFTEGLDRYDIAGVCMRHSRHNRGIRKLLQEAGFERLHLIAGHEIWVRDLEAVAEKVEQGNSATGNPAS